ncbi:Acireductone dioxygenase (Fe(2+)-requiring) protein [Dioscorea alata]|uniref:Acireductone dioxygenase (Fe(2+)-requiring) protein n=1 Tax=Dioscorea alata TaxID=55571 RepID=A0ACB7V6F0_DIOAL|nr:Acireductone dioxygenase (Fe(2+)-requiring) protein [Dioscorea alata]
MQSSKKSSLPPLLLFPFSISRFRLSPVLDFSPISSPSRPPSIDQAAVKMDDSMRDKLKLQFHGYGGKQKASHLMAWLMDESDEDQRLPHHRNPKEFVPLSKLEGPGFDFHNKNGKEEGGCSTP